MTTRRPLGTATALLLALGAVCPGCGEDGTTAAVREADIAFTRVGGGTMAVAEHAETVYGSIEDLLKPHAGQGPTGAGEAASALLASAQLGLAAAAVDQAVGLVESGGTGRDDEQSEPGVRGRLANVRAQVAEWSRLNALADAAATYDPAPELAAIDAELEARRRELTLAETAQGEARARLADLNAQIEDLMARSGSARAEAGEIQLQMSRASGVEAARLAPTARDRLLQADTLELEAQRVRTELERASTVAREGELLIERLEKQRELLTRSRTEVNARARAAREDEETARAAADRSARELRELVSSLEEFRGTELAQAFDRAAGLIRQAVQNARQARTKVETGKVTVAMGEQALAYLETNRAQALLSVARAYESAAALGLSDPYERLGSEVRAEAEAAHAGACEAFGRAASAYRVVRIQGDAADRLARTADVLERLGQTPLGQLPDLDFSTPVEEMTPDAEGWTEDGTAPEQAGSAEQPEGAEPGDEGDG